MSRKIARITQEKKLLLANEVVEGNTKTSLNSDGRLDTDEIIEYPAELEGGRNLIQASWLKNNSDIDFRTGLERSSGNRTIITEFIQVTPQQTYTLQRPVDQGNVGARYYDSDKNHIGSENLGSRRVYTLNIPDGCYYFKFIDEANTLDEGYKFEKGNKATDWTPAPEDLGLNYPDSIQNFNSSISGNNIIAPEFIEGYPFVKPVIDDSLVLWFDGSTGNNYEMTNIWKDLSGNGNDGELRNFGYTENSGWVDGGLKFDGVDDYVISPYNHLFDITEQITLEVWLKTGNEIPLSYMGVFLRQSIGAYEIFIHRRMVTFGLRLDGTQSRHDDGIILEPNTIYHIVCTYNGTEKKIYNNGVNTFTCAISGSISTRLNHLYVGWSGYSNEYFNGTIYSTRLYNRALTDEEILQNYQAGQCSPLLAMRGEVIG